VSATLPQMIRLPSEVRACLFDMDGVLTDTASVHARAWKETFDAFLREQQGPDARPFDIDADYGEYVDGKPREDGVRDFLASRDIHLPEGSPEDPPGAVTVRGVGNSKNALVQSLIEEQGVDVYDGSVRFVKAAREAGLKTAVVSSSANTQQILRSAGMTDLFDARVDGVTIAEEHLKGKPAPDSFLRGAELVGESPDASAVFEDALAGVAAGRAGNFAVTVGVDRKGRADALREHGADVVVSDLSELLG
jgi:beta-phosphoglucomutase family hydrolase